MLHVYLYIRAELVTAIGSSLGSGAAARCELRSSFGTVYNMSSKVLDVKGERRQTHFAMEITSTVVVFR
eukprot:IDg5334t1